MSATSIEWATHVLNAFTGCDKVSPGCAHCYAVDVAAGNQRKELGRARVAAEQGKPEPRMRYQNDGDPRTSGPGFGFTVHWDKLRSPERFPVGARVFVNSMSDVFHEEAPLDAIAALWALFSKRPDVDWLVLTKRPERMLEVLTSERFVRLVAEAANTQPLWSPILDAPLPNVWLGVSIENRRFVHRADLLREAPAAVRFISAEPLLGPLIAPHHISVDISEIDDTVYEPTYEVVPFWLDQPGAGGPAELDLTGIDWLIAGGESGPKHRPIREEWVRDLRDACIEDGVAFFFKQWGGRTAKSGGRELDGRTWDELPAGRAVVA